VRARTCVCDDWPNNESTYSIGYFPIAGRRASPSLSLSLSLSGLFNFFGNYPPDIGIKLLVAYLRSFVGYNPRY
jgi:hypothetical protein